MTWQYAHNKRVTLNLARRSDAAKAVLGLVPALDKLAGLDWDLYKLPQGDVELIYSSFDDEMEKRIKDEFAADPNFLIDHKGAYQACTLCGHYPIRFEFKIKGIQNGQSVNCGSECIISHGLHVQGTETAEQAKKVLEAAIRRQLKRLRLEAWHEATGFAEGAFAEAQHALHRARSVLVPDEGWSERNQRNRQGGYLRHEVRLLERFYTRTGWLGTEKKWDAWIKAVAFARQWGNYTGPVPVTFAQAMGRLPSEDIKDAITPEITSIPSAGGDAGGSVEAEASAIGGTVALEDTAQAAVTKPIPEKDGGLFATVAHQLVFGEGN